MYLYTAQIYYSLMLDVYLCIARRRKASDLDNPVVG
jgi:hypothetical protein